MKILYLCADLGIPLLGHKGAAVHVRELVAALSRAGHTVVVATPLLNKSPWEVPARLEGTELHIPLCAAADGAALYLKTFNEMLGVDSSLPGELRRILYNEDLFCQLKRRLEHSPPMFIYERASLYSVSGVLLAQALDVPLVLELNAPLALEQSAYRGSAFGTLAAEAERWTLSRANAVLLVSDQLREHALAMGLAPERLHVIPNGINGQQFRPARRDLALRETLGLSPGLVLGFVGGLRPWHGVDVLPRLLEGLAPRYPGLRFLVVGDGPLKGTLEQGFRKRGLAQRVVFTGAVPHESVAELMGALDVALAPYEPSDHPFYFSPLKLFEYMACGVPVVAAAQGQIPGVIEDQVTGLLYPPGNLAALTACCERLLEDAALRQRLGEAASKLIHGHYTWDHNAARVTKIASELLARRQPREDPCPHSN